ncbi:Hydrogenase-2 operon protein HybE [Ensifer psoraleae]|uniref:[NiFe]-hydrogenase assembly chaperone HybE n=1 Tax=Sinorhizobium psoraleae TaxID=520838 RepID=UPI0015698E12|nr:[NiFe]-hydrogenase assembly chaperone HybE [Sinorhizobium psoraleae]NRP74930.1 Hydrogenase-2 operon protein HybE [Sinorhizobium psoraleae]
MRAELAVPVGLDPVHQLGQRLEDRYRHVHVTAMADVSICNPALGVAATGCRAFGGRAFGIVTTPWFMNLVAIDLPDGAPSAAAVSGTTLRVGLPAGEVEFIIGELDGIGRVDSCSLFSPVFEFAAMEAALATAEEAVRAFFDLAPLEPPPAPPAAVNRRDVLRGHFQKREAGAET